MRYLLIRDGDEIKLEGDEVLIGRSASCDVLLNDEATASREHAKLRLGSAPTIVDLDTPNGLCVNGKRIVGEQALRSGDLITIGEVELSFVKASTTLAPPSFAPPEEEPLIGDDMTLVNDATAMVCAVARRLLEEDDVEGAQVMLNQRWGKLVTRGHAVHPALAVFAARTGFMVAAASKQPSWADDAAMLLAAADTVPNVETLKAMAEAADVVGLTPTMKTYVEQVSARPEATTLDDEATTALRALATR